MPKPRRFCKPVVLNGFLYVIGGVESQYFDFESTALDRFNPKTSTWTSLPPMTVRRYVSTVATLNNRIYVTGCTDNANNPVECYDPLTNLWTLCASMNMRRSHLTIVALNEFLYGLGGVGFPNSLTVERYDPVSDVWTTVVSLGGNLSYTTGLVLNSTLFAIRSNYDDLFSKIVEKYDANADKWIKMDSICADFADTRSVHFVVVQNKLLYEPTVNVDKL